MPLILNIDTAVNTTYVSLAKDGIVLQSFFSDDQKSNAINLHTAIEDLLQKANEKTSSLHAIAVANGPGSYTGLRVGLATAKGLCYALKIPLITIGTLEMMAAHIITKENLSDCILCPMIDARRMEVFTALYDCNNKEIMAPSALILGNQSFDKLLLDNKVVFFGNGSKKWQNINIYPNALFNETEHFYNSLNIISLNKYIQADFAGLAYAEPLYVKEFHNS
jgi:tRNA threonylcarbamoyladenosine biosynthesis protein TsaB